MKGTELPIRLIAIVILVLAVVVAVIGMFFNVFSKGTKSFYEQGTQAELQSFIESCRMLCEQIQTTESLSLIQMYCNKKAVIGGKEYKCPDVYQCLLNGKDICSEKNECEELCDSYYKVCYIAGIKGGWCDNYIKSFCSKCRNYHCPYISCS